MFKQYSYKQKFYFLLLFFVMLSVAAYRRSFSNLFLLIGEHRTLVQKKDLIASQTPNTQRLQRDIADLESLIGKGETEKEKIQQEIVNFLVNNSNGVTIFELQPIHQYQQEDYLVHSFQLDITGSYNNLIQLANNYEKHFEFSKIVSMRFYTDTKNNQKETLHLRLIFQNYEKTT